MHIWLLFLAGTTVYGISRVSEPDLEAVNFAQPIHGRKLTGNVIWETDVDSEDSCSFECVDEVKCWSYNFELSKNKTEGFKCQLSNSDRFVGIANFTWDENFKYVGIQSPCSSDPCMNNATCVAKYEDDNYQCICAQAFGGKHCEEFPPVDCQDIKTRGDSHGDGMYWLYPDGGSHSNAFQAYCHMTSYNGGWTMCYTTDEYAKRSTEVTYNSTFPYGTDGYRTNCNNIPFTEIMFIDHQTGNKAYFKRKANLPITAAGNYGKNGSRYGLWDGVAVNKTYSFQLLICDNSFYSGFMISGYTGSCYKQCNSWCSDTSSPYFRTASTSSSFKGVAFNTNGHRNVSTRLMSVGLR